MIENRKEHREETNLLGLTGKIYDEMGHYLESFEIADVSEDGLGLKTQSVYKISPDTKVLFTLEGLFSGFKHSGTVKWIAKEDDKFRLGLSVPGDTILGNVYQSVVSNAS